MTQTIDRASREALFCIGSNCGDREGNVNSALEWLAGRMTGFRHSSIYDTPDCHGGMRTYRNAVCVGLTGLSASELDYLCKEYEVYQGRDSAAREAGDVPVDVDIVVFDGEILRKRDFGSEFFLIGYRELGLDAR